MLKLISDKTEIAKCQKLFEKTMKKALSKHEVLVIGFQGGKIENNEVYYNKNLWYSTSLLDGEIFKIPRYWNAFGLGKRKGGNQIIIVEINPPVSGVNKGVGGLFAKDEKTNSNFILHRGIIGGGRRGIGKSAFRNKGDLNWKDVYDDNGKHEEAILIGSLSSQGLLAKVLDFVKKVDRFKKGAIDGTISKFSGSLEDNLSFDPEYFGRKKGKRKSEFEYESNHGLIVTELKKIIQKTIGPKHVIFNNRLVDLGVQKLGKTQKLFEIKTSADRQSIYTGIGQLMFHSAGNSKIEKILVLPLEDYKKANSEIIGKIDIKVITFTISVEGKVKFPPNNSATYQTGEKSKYWLYRTN